MSKGPNTRLNDLFGLAGWSKGELARMVNRQAAAMGHHQLATDTSRVRRWIDMGETPREPVPTVLAALFTERLGRVVTIEDLRFVRQRRTTKRQPDGAKQNPDGVPWAPERTAAVLTEFTGMDLMLNRRGLMGAGAALTAGSALSNAMYDWLHTDPAAAKDNQRFGDPYQADPAGYDRYEAAPIGSQEIEALERSVEVFRAWDASRGGGLQRKAVVGQLNEVGGMLAYHHPDHLQRRLWGWRPTWRCWRAGCRTTSASNPPPRSTSSSPPTRPARAVTGRAPARRSPARPVRWSTSANPTRPWT